MKQQIEYKGYEILGIHNKKVVAQIKENIHTSQTASMFGAKIFLCYEPPIKFVFSSYENMVKFIDQNPR